MSNISSVTRRRFLTSASAAATISVVGPTEFLPVPANALVESAVATITMAMGSLLYFTLQEYIRSLIAQQTAQRAPGRFSFPYFTSQPRPSENDVMITRQLASIHKATDQVLDKLSSFPIQFDSLLRAHSARELHLDVLAAMKLYQDEVDLAGR
jgi:hypothetical protein